MSPPTPTKQMEHLARIFRIYILLPSCLTLPLTSLLAMKLSIFPLLTILTGSIKVFQILSKSETLKFFMEGLRKVTVSISAVLLLSLLSNSFT